MKRILSILMLFVLLLAVLPVGGLATEVETTEAEIVIRDAYQCGEDMTWSYDAGTLTISGNGNMDDYPDGDAPWLEYKDSITRVVITGNVTSIGSCAFMDYDNITSVDFGSAMHTISYRAFKSCDGLTAISLPSTFRRFGEECFMSCLDLTEIRCNGGMPSFNANCLWDTYCNIYYPGNNPWPAEPVTQLFQAFQGRIQFYMGEPSYATPVETTPAATEAPTTEPTTAPTEETIPENTEETTEATTEATTEPTEEVTEEPAEEETVPETTEKVEEKKGSSFSGVWFGLFIITGTLSLILIGALVFRRRSY